MTNAQDNIDKNSLAHDRVYKGLRLKIMYGQIQPGQSLTLRGIGESYGVSMTPSREAVRRLVAEGALAMTASGRVFTPELTNERIEELAAMRSLIEVELSSRALPRAHLALIDRLQAINARVAQAIDDHDAVTYIKTNLEFHRTLYLRAQAPSTLALVETIWLQYVPMMRALYDDTSKSQAPNHHRKILSTLRAGDEPGLKLAVRADVTNGLRMLVEM